MFCIFGKNHISRLLHKTNAKWYRKEQIQGVVISNPYVLVGCVSATYAELNKNVGVH